MPLWGTPHEGHASEKTGQPTLLADLAPLLAPPGVAAGAYIDGAAAALGTEGHRAARGATRCIPRRPATENEGGRLMTEAVAPNAWAEGGVLAPTTPPTHRPVTSSKAAAGAGRLYGTPARAVGGHARALDKRPPQRLQRDLQPAQSARPPVTRPAAQQA